MASDDEGGRPRRHLRVVPEPPGGPDDAPGGPAPAYGRVAWERRPRSARDPADAFFASPEGARLDDPLHHELLEHVLAFATTHPAGDPDHWSTTSVELLLTDWFPGNVVGSDVYLGLLPDLLRAYVRHAHARTGTRPDLTAATLAAVDRLEPVYDALVREAPWGEWLGPDDEAIRVDGLEEEEIVLELLARGVGGRAALLALDAEPLPDEPVDWTDVPDDARAAVAEVLALGDATAEALFDTEHRTAVRRLVVRAARHEPDWFTRPSSPARSAAAAVWAVARGNRTLDTWSATRSLKALLGHLGVSGGVSDRARGLLRAAGLELTITPHLRDPSLLVSYRRAELVAARDEALRGEEPEAF